MKRRELERHLRAHGCRRVDERADHSRWIGPSGSRSVTPRQPQIDDSLVRRVCRQLKVSPPASPAKPSDDS